MDDPYRPPTADLGRDHRPKTLPRAIWDAWITAARHRGVSWKFWEIGRIIHGIVLLLVCAGCVFVKGIPSLSFFSLNFGRFVGMVLFANFAFTLGYVIEIFALFPYTKRAIFWLRLGVFILGTWIAAFLTAPVMYLELLSPPYID